MDIRGLFATILKFFVLNKRIFFTGILLQQYKSSRVLVHFNLKYIICDIGLFNLVDKVLKSALIYILGKIKSW